MACLRPDRLVIAGGAYVFVVAIDRWADHSLNGRAIATSRGSTHVTTAVTILKTAGIRAS